MTYDELDTAPEATAKAVLRALGLSDSRVAVPRLSRQRDDLSTAWAQRYRRDRDPAVA